MNVLINVLILAILVESITEIIGSLFNEGRIVWKHAVSVLVGIIIAAAVGIDIFVVLKLYPDIPIIGVVATGFIISRGSNAVHDLMNRLNGIQNVTIVSGDLSDPEKKHAENWLGGRNDE